MPRIACYGIGLLNGGDPNYLNYFKANTVKTIGPSTTNFWTIPFSEALALIDRYASVVLDYSIDTASGGGIESFTGTFLNVADERSLICAHPTFNGYDVSSTPGGGGWISAITQLSDYDNSTKDFSLGYNFTGDASFGVSSETFYGGLPTGIVATVFGRPFTFYQDGTAPVFATGHYTLDINFWLPFDDGVAYDPMTNPFNGPIWDAGDGHAILSPTPQHLVGA